MIDFSSVPTEDLKQICKVADVDDATMAASAELYRRFRRKKVSEKLSVA